MDIPTNPKIIDRIFECLQKSVGGATAPWRIRREGFAHADVRRYEALSDARAQMEIEQLRLEREKRIQAKPIMIGPLPTPLLPREGVVQPVKIEPVLPKPKEFAKEMLELSSEREDAKNVQKLANIRAVHRLAEEKASEGTQKDPPEEKPSPEWINAWIEGAELASDEDLQEIWAKILCGEINKPGTHGRRTLEYLRMISKQEADLIRKLADHVAEGNFLRTAKYDELIVGQTPEDTLSFDEIIELQDIGIIGDISDRLFFSKRSSQRSEQDHYVALSLGQDWYLSIQCEREFSINFPIWPLTKVGKEIMRIGDYRTSDVAISKFVSLLSQYCNTPVVSLKKMKVIFVSPERGTIVEEIKISTI